MIFSIIGVFLTIAVLVFWSMKRKYAYFKNNGIPFIPTIPVFGNMSKTVFKKKHFANLTVEHYKNFPDSKYFGIFNFMTPVIVLRDLDLIKSVTIKNFDHFSDRHSFINEEMDPLLANNLESLKGEKWREARNLLSPAFTGSKMKGMYELMVSCTEKFINHLKKLPEKNRAMLDTKDLFTRFTNDVIATCAFGISIDSLADPKNDFYVYGRRATKFEGIQAIKFFLARAFPQVMTFFKIELI